MPHVCGVLKWIDIPQERLHFDLGYRMPGVHSVRARTGVRQHIMQLDGQHAMHGVCYFRDTALLLQARIRARKHDMSNMPSGDLLCWRKSQHVSQQHKLRGRVQQNHGMRVRPWILWAAFQLHAVPSQPLLHGRGGSNGLRQQLHFSSPEHKLHRVQLQQRLRRGQQLELQTV